MMRFRLCKWRSYSLAASLLLALLFAPLAAAEPARIALVITNQEYSLDALKLENTHRDGEIVKAALEQVGFRVWVERDTPNQAALERAIGEHIKRLAEAGSDAVGFLYYSGHGAADGPDGRNYLLPTGAQVTHAAQLPLSALSVQQITGALARAGSRINFVVFDACRNVPLQRSDKSDFKGFAPFRQEPGLLIAYATEPGNVAVDSSLYARALAEEIVRPGREAGSVFRAVSGRVYQATNQRQRPDIIDRRFDDFVFTAALPAREQEGGPAKPAIAPQQPAPQAPTGNPLAAGGYEAKQERLIRTLSGHGGTVTAAAFSPDGRTIVSASWEGTVKLWDAGLGREIATLGHSDGVTAAAFSPDGKTIVSASANKTLILWDAGKRREIRNFIRHEGQVHDAAFSPDGNTIVSAGWDNTVKLWNVRTGREILTLAKHEQEVNAAAFSPDGKIIVSASHDKTLKLSATDSGREIKTLKGHSGSVYAAAFSPDGKTIVSASRDKTLKIWNADTGTEIRSLVGHEDEVFDAAFSPDGKTIVSASRDNSVKLWNAATGREITTLAGHGHLARTAAFSPDGKTVVSGGCDLFDSWKICTRGDVKLWDVSEWTQPESVVPSTTAPQNPPRRSGIPANPADAFRQGLEDGARLREQLGLDGGQPGSGKRFPSIIQNQ